MASIIPAPQLQQQETRGDEVIPLDVTLAVANTSETLFTVPVGKRLRALAVVNRGGIFEVAHVSLTQGAPATTGDVLVGRFDALNLDELDLPEGTYAFIGGTGHTPRLVGFAIVGPPVS